MEGVKMRFYVLGALALLTSCMTQAGAQQKVAEGEYEMHGTQPTGAPSAKTATRWVLLTKTGGGYYLESEIQNQPAGMRVVQVEDLNERLVPTAIGYRLYREGQKNPGITASCEFSNRSIVCSGESGKDIADVSAPHHLDGPFWFWIEGLFSLDMPWLLGGAVNMAHMENGKVNIATLTVSGGSGVLIGDAVSVAKLKAVQRPGQTLTVIAPDKPIPWDFDSEEESVLEFVATEQFDFNGAKLAVRHYTFANGPRPMNLWITASGLLIKLGEGPGDFVLANYKQYTKLIPELPVEPAPADSTPHNTN